MNQAFDLSSVRILLRRMVANGQVTLEQLDTPSLSWQENAKSFRLHFPKFQQPVFQNLLREPQDRQEAVSTSDPRDFTQDQGLTPAQAPQLPLQEPPALTPFNPEEDNW